MSLNWKEIDLALSELDLVGAKIEKIIQPSYDSLSLGLYKGGKSTELFISIAQGACRLHALSSPPPKPDRPLRFMECLRSRIKGGRIDSISQIGRERVVKLELSVSRSIEFRERDLASGIGIEMRKFILYARLWSGAGNIVLVDEEGMVVDAIARRPKKGEVSGESCAIEEDLLEAAARNAEQGFRSWHEHDERREQALGALTRALHLARPPRTRSGPPAGRDRRPAIRRRR
jgi:predicted ribosome quality control (RQC) complex YloA/Tae2 family protein